MATEIDAWRVGICKIIEALKFNDGQFRLLNCALPSIA